MHNSFAMYEAFDTSTPLIGKVNEIQAAGISAIGVYARSDRTPFLEVQELVANGTGIKLWTISEHGYPTEPRYFTQAQARADAAATLAWCKMVGQPEGTSISPAADYDCAVDDVWDYFVIFHEVIKEQGFLMMPYGNGALLKALKDAGYAHWTFLAQSTGWDQYVPFEPFADILQGPTSKFVGVQGDGCIVRESAAGALWGGAA